MRDKLQNYMNSASAANALPPAGFAPQYIMNQVL